MSAARDALATRLIDLRSDTVTQPTAAMRRAMADAEVGDDVLDGDPTTRRLEALTAELLGKEQALFFPSGTMANQAAIWLHCAPGTEIFVDSDSHIVQWEMAGAAALCGVQVRTVKGSGLTMQADDLTRALRLPSDSATDASLVCVENTHNGAGGTLTSVNQLRALRDVATRAKLPVHLDGARLWNATAATGTSLAEFAACVDTVMVSFSKGLGAPIGAALAGSRDVMERASRVRKRFGGGLRQSGVIAAAALHGIEHHRARLGDDHAAARYFANAIDGVGGAKVVPPDTNIVMIDLPTPTAGDIVQKAKAAGLRLSHWDFARVRAVMHLDAPQEVVEEAARRLRRIL